MEELPEPSKYSHHGIRLECTNRRAGDSPNSTVRPPKLFQFSSAQAFLNELRSALLWDVRRTVTGAAELCPHSWSRGRSLVALRAPRWCIRAQWAKLRAAETTQSYWTSISFYQTIYFLLPAFGNVWLGREGLSLVFLLNYADLSCTSLHRQNYSSFWLKEENLFWTTIFFNWKYSSTWNKTIYEPIPSSEIISSWKKKKKRKD